MKIAIAGVTGFRNRGVEALVRPTVEQLLDRYPESEVVIASWTPDYDRRRMRDDRVQFVRDHYLDRGPWVYPVAVQPRLSGWGEMIRHSARWMRTRVSCSAMYQKPQNRMPFEGAHILLVSGGDLLSSDYGTQSLRHFLAPVSWAKCTGVPVVLLGHSIGPFRCEEDVSLWRQFGECADVIAVREPLTYEYLRTELQCPAARVIETADAAFLLSPDFGVSSQLDSLRGRPIVAVSISEHICRLSSSDYDVHLDAWCKLIHLMLENWGVNVAVIPHVQESYADDRWVAAEMLRKIGGDQRVRVFGEEFSAAEYKGIISQCDMLIAERMHAAIAGLSSGVCTVAIGYSVKALGIMHAVLDKSTFAPESLVIPIEQFNDWHKTADRLAKIWRRRESYAEAIAAARVSMTDRAKLNFALIDKCVVENCDHALEVSHAEATCVPAS